MIISKRDFSRMPKHTSDAEDLRVVAIIAAFNESDILPGVVQHLVENGISIYLIDNWSTDGTVDSVRSWFGRGIVGLERFPADPSGGEQGFPWGDLLRRKEQLSHELEGDWFIHHDADEIREAPWPGCSLRDAIRWVNDAGYNCIDFSVLNFQPVDNNFTPGCDPKGYFRFFEFGRFELLQRKCWAARSVPVSLAESGGHDVAFSGRRVFPIRFLLRHYRIRSDEHGRRKVHSERKARFLREERERGWHTHYNHIQNEQYSFLRDPSVLTLFDSHRVRLELLLHDEIECNGTNGSRSTEEGPVNLICEYMRSLVEVRKYDSHLENHVNPKALDNWERRLTNQVAALRSQLIRVSSCNAEREKAKPSTVGAIDCESLNGLWRDIWQQLLSSI